MCRATSCHSFSVFVVTFRQCHRYVLAPGEEAGDVLCCYRVRLSAGVREHLAQQQKGYRAFLASRELRPSQADLLFCALSRPGRKTVARLSVQRERNRDTAHAIIVGGGEVEGLGTGVQDGGQSEKR